MDTDQADSSERERRLDDVVAEYLNGLAAGSAPDREALLTRHPDLAPDLASFFDDRDRLDRWTRPLRSGAAAIGFPSLGPLSGSRASGAKAAGLFGGSTTQ